MIAANLALLLTACSDDTVTAPRPEPSFVYVEMTAGEAGTIDSPLPFSSTAQSRTFRVTAMDRDGNPYAVDADLTVDVRPGKLEARPWVRMEGGVWEGEVTFRNGYGPTRVWFSDLGDLDETSTRVPGFATGVSEPLYFALPTLGEMNATDDHETSQLDREFAELRSVDRDIRVTAVGTNGFWVTDLADAPGSFNYLFVYTFQRPDDAVQVGARLSLLTGAAQEYLATTQISFPNYEVSPDAPATMPDPISLTRDMCGQDLTLEGIENGLVRIEGGVIPTAFTPGSPEYDDYLEYGQWPVRLDAGDSCSFYVNSGLALPDYTPVAGQSLPSITGLLSEIWGMWILTPRDAADVDLGASGPPAPTTASSSLMRPIARPRPTHP